MLSCFFFYLLKACENGTYGLECMEMCGHCSNSSVCNNVNGTCLDGCDPGYTEHLCKTRT